MYMLTDDSEGISLAIIARKFSTAVARNKAKRRIREAIRQELVPHGLGGGLHVVVRIERVVPSYENLRNLLGALRKRDVWTQKN